MRNRRAKQSQVPAREKIADKVAGALDVPKSAFLSMPQIELSGNREAVVDGCKGILEYDESVIRLNLGAIIIRFTGQNLMIKSMNDEVSVVSGLFTSIEFST